MSDGVPPPSNQGFGPALVVGVGASAGGLGAFRQLLAALGQPAGMAFLLVQHLDPTHGSALAELLAPSTPMEMVEAEDGAAVRAGVVYVIRPGTDLGVRGGRLVVTAPTARRGARHPIDHLFRSLAREYGPRAAGVVLSGAGSDGSAGVREIKAAGGLTVAQDPVTADQPGMPRSAAGTGAVDLVLPIPDIPAALLRFQSLPPSARAAAAAPPDSGEAPPPPGEPPVELDEQALAHLAASLGAHAHIDLRLYKPGTVKRRVVRRMTLVGDTDVGAYLRRLRDDDAERHALFRDLLIGVTDFFRDPEAFDALRAAVIEPLVREASEGDTLRAWVPGCATGEEAYSIAIEILEAAAGAGKRLALQVFATDVDQEALAAARLGLYSASIAERVPAHRLQRYFLSFDEQGYQVRPALRDVVSFAAHDLTKDPPFSRMHLVSCRNVLIYLRAAAQEHALELFHFALLPGGALFLGSSESTGPRRQLFATLSKEWRVYRKVGVSRPLVVPRGGYRAGALREDDPPGPRSQPAEPERGARRAPAIGDLARRVVLAARVPPTVVVAESGAVLFMHGELRPYLRFPDGEPRFDVSALLSPDLSTRTRAALYKCRRDRVTVVAYSSMNPLRPGRTKITASPGFELGDGAVILSFEEVDGAPAAAPSPDTPAQDALIAQLEKELQATREDLRNTVEELETSNEELRSANEESLSMNEELQSANEELEATSEELRSLNEELTTVNAQLREKVEQLEQAHDDLSNFFASTRIATLFLDEKCCIERFTPAAEELLRVDVADEGRFVGDIARELLQSELVEEARQVLSRLGETARELRTRDGRWVARRVLPYRTEAGRVEGVVVTFVDITDLKRTSEQLAARERQQAVIARLGLRALEAPLLQDFLDQAVREVQQTLETDYCKVLEVQPGGELLLLRAGVGWREGLVSSVTVPAGIDSQAGYTLRSEGPVIVEDLARERRFHGPALLVDHGVKSGISCVIRAGDEPYGVLGAHSREARAFTREDANFLQAVATVLAGAVNRHQIRKRLTIEGAAARALAEARSLEDAAARVHAAAATELRTAVGELWQPGKGGELERTAVFAAPPYDAATVEREFGPTRFRPPEGFVGRVFGQGRAEWLSSLQSERLFLRVESARRLGLASGIALPIASGGEVVGVLAFFSSGRLHADSTSLRSLESIGRSIGDFVRRIDAERRLRTTVDGAPVGISDRTLAGRWLRVNDRLCQITGYSREELLSHTFADITHPDDLEHEEVLQREMREGKRERYWLEKRYIRKDGAPIWVSVSVAMVPKPSGEPDYCVAVVEDISARRAAEDALRTSEERFRRILHESPAPVLVHDDEGKILLLSRSWTAVTGYTREDTPTMRVWFERAFRERAPEVERLIRSVWEGEPAVREHEFDVCTKTGETRTLLFSAVPLDPARDGRGLRVVAATDVTERRRYERELLEASRQKDEFIAMLGHELRNPLAAVRNATELLKRTHPDDARIRRTQSILERQTTHMAKLLDGLLDISRIIHGKIVLERGVVDLAAVVAEVVRDGAERLPEGLELRADLPSVPLPVEGDPVRLAQVVDNLVSNAIKYTPPPGRIAVQLAGEGGAAVLRIKDTGSGIDADLLPHLFTPFRQGRQSLDRAQGGLGLGLALVKILVELHGGQVAARSDGPGRGAELEVRLPLAAAEPPAARPGDGERERLRVLVVEDNEDAAEALRDALEFQGHEVALASRGQKGIELARQLLPDVVLCDLGLPDGVTGFDVARALRADPRTRPLYLVALTGYGRPEDKQQCVEAGFDAHLTKPVTFEALDRAFASPPLRARG